MVSNHNLLAYQASSLTDNLHRLVTSNIEARLSQTFRALLFLITLLIYGIKFKNCKRCKIF